MSYLIGIILSCDDRASLPVREHWPLHAALREVHERLQSNTQLLARWEAAGLPTLRLTPDDEVGMRARGVTAALWRLAEGGDLEIEEDERGLRLRPVVDYYSVGRRRLLRLDPELADIIQRAGQRFAASLTASSK
jgi:hypothetical protein